MTRSQIKTLLTVGIVVLVLALLMRHFQAMAVTPLPNTQGLLGD